MCFELLALDLYHFFSSSSSKRQLFRNYSLFPFWTSKLCPCCTLAAVLHTVHTHKHTKHFNKTQSTQSIYFLECKSVLPPYVNTERVEMVTCLVQSKCIHSIFYRQTHLHTYPVYLSWIYYKSSLSPFTADLGLVRICW